MIVKAKNLKENDYFRMRGWGQLCDVLVNKDVKHNLGDPNVMVDCHIKGSNHETILNGSFRFKKNFLVNVISVG